MPYSNIDKPSKYFNTVTYAGAGTTTQAVTGVGFSPDFIWIKNRSDAYSHVLQDICRGFGATKNLSSNSTNAEGASGATGDNYGHVSTSDSDGFTVTHTINGSNDGGTIRKGTHYSGDNYVGWCWDANGAGVSNTSGTISSTVSANTTSGFSIVTYTGNGSSSATVGHGLGVAPSMILNKCRTGANAAQAFFIYHKGLSANNMIAFNTNAQAGTGTYSSGILSTSPTSTTFGFTAGSGGVLNNNESSSTYVSYCFAEVKGFSKFGSYTGNGSTDGTFIYTGMRPAFLMLKRTDTTGSWQMYDNKRDTYNPEISRLGANLSSEESTSASIYIDFLSNGFKMRNSTADWNASGGTYIYMCFAEQPFTSSKGIVANAR
jgi:hypothetical protein